MRGQSEKGWTATAIGSRVLVFTLVLARSYTHARTQIHTNTHPHKHMHTQCEPQMGKSSSKLSS